MNDTPIPTDPTVPAEPTDPLSEIPPTGSSEPSNKPKKKRSIIALLLIIALVVIGLEAGQMWHKKPAAKQITKSSSSSPAQSRTADPYRLVYSIQKGHEENADKRSFPVYELWYQDLGSQPQMIASFGGKADYLNMSDSKITPDGKTLILGYDTKIDFVDIASGKVTNVWKAPHDYSLYGIVFNSDASQLLISSANAPGSSSSSFGAKVEQLDMHNLSTRLAYGNVSQAPLGPRVWRADNKVIVDIISFSEFTIRGLLDLNAAQLTTQEHVANFYVSDDGMSTALPSTNADNSCDAFAESYSDYNVIDPVTHKSKGKVSVTSGYYISRLEFNRNGTQVLVEAKPVLKDVQLDDKRCQDIYNQAGQLSIVDVASTTKTAVASRQEAYKKWYPDEPYAETKRQNNKCTLQLFDSTILSSDCSNGEDTYTLLGIAHLK